jgi:hypothetical protein
VDQERQETRLQGSPRLPHRLQGQPAGRAAHRRQGRARGGAIEHAALDGDADYLMHAWTSRWVEMGKGEYGPTKAMFLGRLEFQGPMLEAMGNMGPFSSFLLLVGKVPSTTGSCPK